MSEAWTIAVASEIGTSHTKSNSPLQDRSACEIIEERGGESVLVAVVSDGAGSASRSEEGAEIVCREFVKTLKEWLQSNGMEDFSKTTLQRAQTIGRKAILDKAESEGVSASEFACTLLGAVVMPQRVGLIQVGDGAIVYSRQETPEEYRLFRWPAKGEYENTTFFLTDAEETLESNVQSEILPFAVSRIALFTDGIERLCLDFKTQTPFSPFFEKMFGNILATEKTRDELSGGLHQFLSSPGVNARTDDDKSLILAVKSSSPLHSLDERV